MMALDPDQIGRAAAKLANRLSILDMDAIHPVYGTYQTVPNPLVQEVCREAARETGNPSGLPLLELREIITGTVDRVDERMHEAIAQILKDPFGIRISG